MHNENTNEGFFWTFSEDEAKTLVKILHKSNPIDPSIIVFIMIYFCIYTKE